jgi:prepilin-type N-terminal cleavage/methylation domain-containing protein
MRRPAARAGAFSLLELLIALTVIAIVAVVAIPSLLTARMRANEASVVSTLRRIAAAQSRFKASAAVDLDADGVGEYGFLKELSGESCVRGAPDGQRLGAAASPAPLPPEFAAIGAGGELSRTGYRFRVFLPGAGGAGVGETENFPVEAAVDARLAAATWCCYAWPTRRGTSGRRAFFVNHEDRVVATDAESYSGPGRFTPEDCGAALVRGADGRSIATMTGDVAAGTRGRDGNVWRRAF